jgi:hypothetical protein
MRGLIIAATFAVLAAGCAQILGIRDLPCEPGCFDSKTRRVCTNGHASAEACDLASAPICLVGEAGGACVACFGDGDCPDPKGRCSMDHRCVECVRDEQCPGERPHCSPAETCVECLNDTYCPNTAPRCGPASTCVVCVRDGDCSGTTPHCGPLATCVACYRDDQCGSDAPHCGPLSTCVVCARDEHCPVPTESCRRAICAQSQCTVEIAPGQSCGTQGTCNDDGACMGSNMMLAARFYHVCARLQDDSLWCWGYNTLGEVGNGAPLHATDVPVRVELDAGSPILQVAPGYFHSCAVTSDGRAYCWGSNIYGELGQTYADPTGMMPQPTPLLVQSSGVRFKSIEAGQFMTCAISESDELYCWGANDVGQCGTGNLDEAQVLGPRRVQGLPPVKMVSATRTHVCAITMDEALYCWGLNSDSEVALPHPPCNDQTLALLGCAEPTPVHVELGGLVKDVATYTGQTCAIWENILDSYVSCWGDDREGQLGCGDCTFPDMSTSTSTPKRVLVRDPMGHSTPLLYPVRIFPTTGVYACAQTTIPIGISCWGKDEAAAIGFSTPDTIGNEFPFAIPAQNLPPTMTNLALADRFACGIDVPPTGPPAIACWGDLGYDAMSSNFRPKDQLQYTPLPVRWR